MQDFYGETGFDGGRPAAPHVIVLAALVISCLLLWLCVARGAETPPMPAADAAPPALALDAPKSVPAGSGYFKVRAAAAGPVAFDVEAQFEDEGVKFQSEQLDASTLLVGVPASAGVIRVEAAAAGEPGKPPAIAKVFIEVTAARPKEPPAPPPGPAVGKLFAVFVVDKAAAGGAVALAESPTLLKSLRDGGDERSVLDAHSPALEAQGLSKFVADAGGAPCLVLMDEKGDVHLAVKLPADEAGVIALIKDAHTGK